MNIKIISYNLHKGKNTLGQKLSFTRLKTILKKEDFDIGLFQEVLGPHQHNEEALNQIEFLADEKWNQWSFAKNSVVANFDHGNAILSKFKIIDEKIIDLTINPYENRCAILTTLDLGTTQLICVCTHLNLRQKDRLKQASLLLNFINKNTDPNTPIILGGDFNDWNGNVSSFFQREGGFYSPPNQPSIKTFPSFSPVFPLDRIMGRNVNIVSIDKGITKIFRSFSDHLPLYCHTEVN